MKLVSVLNNDDDDNNSGLRFRRRTRFVPPSKNCRPRCLVVTENIVVMFG